MESGVNRIFAVEYVVRDFINTEINPHTDATTVMCHAEIESLITEKQETLDMQKDLFLDAKQEQLTKLSKLDEFDEEVIRYLIDYVLVYDNEHIEIRWNFDDFQAG